MPKPVARYAITFGLSGCYMPDSHGGAHEFTTRKELADMIRSELETYNMPASLFREVRIRPLWAHIKRHGASSASFSLIHGSNALEFHGLTEAEFIEQTAREE